MHTGRQAGKKMNPIQRDRSPRKGVQHILALKNQPGWRGAHSLFLSVLVSFTLIRIHIRSKLVKFKYEIEIRKNKKRKKGSCFLTMISILYF